MIERADLTSLLRRAAGKDLEGVPLYVVMSEGLPPELQVGSDTYGYAGPHLDLALQSYLDSVGEWQGRGAALVINHGQIQKDMQELAGDDPSLVSVLTKQRVVGTGLHELAHLLEQPLYLREAPFVASDFNRIALAAWCKTPVGAMPVPWVKHDANFVRILAHVIHRAEATGIDRMPRLAVFDGRLYGLSRLETYEGTLAQELVEFTGTFAELRETQPPKAFVDLWREDVRQWVDDLSNLSQIVASIVDALTLFNEV